jgi:hypothetical protein
LRDGFVENQRSKAILLLACHQLNVHYFPAYELLLDDLRDYRFYEADMIHPNAVAVDYIWSFFKQTYCNVQTQHFFLEIDKINAAKQHRPFNPESLEYVKFKEEQNRAIGLLKEKYSMLDFSGDIEFFS